MDEKKIEKLFKLLEKHQATRIRVREGDNEIEVEKCGAAPPVVFNAPQPPVSSTKEDTANYITSPMVGTYYNSPSPDAPIFVKVGDRINKDTIVCIIEAMKVMNEVKAGVSGVIKEVMLESGHPVEYGTKLFKLSS